MLLSKRVDANQRLPDAIENAVQDLLPFIGRAGRRVRVD